VNISVKTTTINSIKLSALVALAALLIFALASCNGNEPEPPHLIAAAPTHPTAPSTPPPMALDNRIRLGFLAEPQNQFIRFADIAQNYFPYEADFITHPHPISDVYEMTRRLLLPPGDQEMINAAILSFPDFAQVYQAGARLRLVSLVYYNEGGNYQGLFLREELVQQPHLSTPLVAGFTSGVEGINNHYLIGWDNTRLVLAMRTAFEDIGEPFTRESANSIFYAGLIPPLRNAEAPTITYVSDHRSAFSGEFSVVLTVIALSPDGGELSFQWYCADTNTPLRGETSNTFSVFGDTPARLNEDVESETLRFFVRVTNTNNNVSGRTTAYETSDIITVLIMHEPIPPYYDIYIGRVFFYSADDTTARFRNEAQQLETIRYIVDNHVFGRSIHSILIEGHFYNRLRRETPIARNLELCVNRALLVEIAMRNMGVYVPILTRYNTDVVFPTPEEAMSATIRIVGRD